MAIVKFISDTNCQLFIDMELAGEVHADNMLKISLETGSYLVEAKNTDGKCLKKYELKIKSTDSQVLQDLALEKTMLNETIEKLRNDSSLRFYNQRAVFFHKCNYGYINSLYKVVIEPIYSFADNFISTKAFVRRTFPNGEMATLIDTDGNICLDQWYNYIGCNDKTILLKSKNAFIVLSRENYSFIKEYQDAGYDGKSDLIPVHKEIGVDDMYGYIDQAGAEAIPLIYDYAWNFEENGFAKVKRFGVIYAVGTDGTLFYDLEQVINDGEEFSRGESRLEDPLKTEIVEVYRVQKLSKEESERRGFDFLQYYPLKEGNQWGLSYYNKSAISLYCCDRFLYLNEMNENYLIYRKDGICIIKDHDTSYYFDADEVIANFQIEYEGYCGHDEISINNVIVKKSGKYGLVDLDGKTLLPTEYDLISPTEAIQGNKTGVIGIIWKDGKCSFVWMSNGEILEPFKYEDIIVNKADGSTWQMWATYLVKENGKYGCIDFDRKPILPSIYDAIDYNLEIDSDGYYYKMLLYKEGKVGTYEFRNYHYPSEKYNGYNEIELVFSVEPEYDECVFLRHKAAVTNFAGMSYVAVRKNNKWGIIDNKPSGLHYYYDFNDRWNNSPNLNKLEFKYKSLEELKNDADAEFARRRDEYNERHRVCYDDYTEEIIESDTVLNKQTSYENFKKEVEIELYKLYPDRKRNRQLMREYDTPLSVYYVKKISPSEAAAAMVSSL